MSEFIKRKGKKREQQSTFAFHFNLFNFQDFEAEPNRIKIAKIK